MCVPEFLTPGCTTVAREYRATLGVVCGGRRGRPLHPLLIPRELFVAFPSSCLATAFGFVRGFERKALCFDVGHRGSPQQQGI